MSMAFIGEAIVDALVTALYESLPEHLKEGFPNNEQSKLIKALQDDTALLVNTIATFLELSGNIFDFLYEPLADLLEYAFPSSKAASLADILFKEIKYDSFFSTVWYSDFAVHYDSQMGYKDSLSNVSDYNFKKRHTRFFHYNDGTDFSKKGVAPTVIVHAMETRDNQIINWIINSSDILVTAVPTVFLNSDISNTTIEISGIRSGYTLDNAILTIPSIFNGKTVTAIGESAFASQTQIFQVTLPADLITIGDSAFDKCEYLGYWRGIEIPASVESIGEYAFRYCVRLKSITFAGESRLKDIGFAAFAYCEILEGITIPKSVENIENAAFQRCSNLKSLNFEKDGRLKKLGRVFFDTGLTNVIIPANIIELDTTFSGCTSLRTVEFESGSKLTTIVEAFSGCTSLYGTMTLPDSVTNIGFRAFANTNLQRVYMSDNVTSIGRYAFVNCKNLEVINIPYSVTSIDMFAFEGWRSNQTINILGRTTKHGGWDADWNKNCSAVIEWDPSIIRDGIFAFKYINNKTAFEISQNRGAERIGTEIKIPEIYEKLPVTEIAEDAFWGDFTKVTIPNSITTIGKYAFAGCFHLTEVVFEPGSKLTTIDTNVFYYCNELTTISIPDSVTTIGDYAFAYCKKLTQITIPASVTSIASTAFNDCETLAAINVNVNNQSYSSNDGVLFNKIKTILVRYPAGKPSGAYTIPNDVTFIENCAFYGCFKLTDITILSKVAYIGDYVFYGCTGLTSISVNGNNTNFTGDGNCLIRISDNTLIKGCKDSIIPDYVEIIDDYAFYGCRNLTNITIPYGVTTIGNSAFSGCYDLTKITISDSVTSIGSWVFRDCNKITEIIIPDSVINVGVGIVCHWTPNQTVYVK